MLVGGAAAAQEPAVDPTVEPPAVQYWAGRFVTSGSRRVPVLGDVDYRTETLTLSEVRPVDGGFELSQRTCEVRFAKTAGAKLHMAPGGPAGMPPSTLRMTASGGMAAVEPWTSGWVASDLDGDGRPGITIHVDAPVCGGQIMVASAARSTATDLEPAGAGWTGNVAIWTEQTVLDTRGVCLGLFSRSSEETMRGRFRYAPVPVATCEAVDWDAVPEVSPSP